MIVCYILLNTSSYNLVYFTQNLYILPTVEKYGTEVQDKKTFGKGINKLVIRVTMYVQRPINHLSALPHKIFLNHP